VSDERSEEFARAPRPAAARSEAGRARGAGGRETYRPHAAPGGIDGTLRPVVSPVLRSSGPPGALVRPHRSRKQKPPLVAGASSFRAGWILLGGYFFFVPFFAGLPFTTGLAFFTGAFFAAAFFAAGFTGRDPGVAIFDCLPSEATSPK